MATSVLRGRFARTQAIPVQVHAHPSVVFLSWDHPWSSGMIRMDRKEGTFLFCGTMLELDSKDEDALRSATWNKPETYEFMRERLRHTTVRGVFTEDADHHFRLDSNERLPFWGEFALV
jgi:hypothetical protein